MHNRPITFSPVVLHASLRHRYHSVHFQFTILIYSHPCACILSRLSPSSLVKHVRDIHVAVRYETLHLLKTPFHFLFTTVVIPLLKSVILLMVAAGNILFTYTAMFFFYFPFYIRLLFVLYFIFTVPLSVSVLCFRNLQNNLKT